MNGVPLRDISCRVVISGDALRATRFRKPGSMFVTAFKQEARGIAAFCRAEGRRMWPSLRRYRRAFRRSVRRDIQKSRMKFGTIPWWKAHAANAQPLRLADIQAAYETISARVPENEIVAYVTVAHVTPWKA